MKKLIAFLLCTALLAGMSVCFADDEQERLPSATESAGA